MAKEVLKTSAGGAAMIPLARIENRILLLRGQKVLIDRDLAQLYGVKTRVLNQAVKRNMDRFPEDFMFCLSPEEKQEVVTNCDHLKNLKYSSSLPHAFTEYGAIMAANLLNSPRAVEASIFVVRAFVRLRQMIASHAELARQLNQMDKKLQVHDKQIMGLVKVIKELIEPPLEPAQKEPFGFHPKRKKK